MHRLEGCTNTSQANYDDVTTQLYSGSFVVVVVLNVVVVVDDDVFVVVVFIYVNVVVAVDPIMFGQNRANNS